MTEKCLTINRVAARAFVAMVWLAMVCLALPTFAQQSKTVSQGPEVIKEFKHDSGPLLREIAPLLPEFSAPIEREIENHVGPVQHFNHPLVQKDEVLQTEDKSPRLQTPNFSLEFDGLGFGDAFFCSCMPPDNDGAAGTTQYVQYINLTYAVYDKSGNMVLGPLGGNSFWSGFGGSCENDNSGDPVVRFDAAAQRWVVAQFAINSAAPDYECIAVSQTADATGAYNRYAFPSTRFPDYPKFGVWPDAYYFTFNNFTILAGGSGGSFVGANVCAADRTNMLAGNAATMHCFQRSANDASLLPSDLDGPTPPPAGTPNFFMELDPSGADLDMFKFHVDFTTPANTTFTGPTKIPVAAFTPLCGSSGFCVKQPTSGSDLLEALADRLMYRLVYRNFGDHTTLLATHSVQAGSSGGARWYEIRNPETTPTVFQSGTFAPDSQYRWMPAMAMDQNQDIFVGFSRSGSAAGQFPSLVYAGRTPSDPPGTLESEVVLKAGAGSQISLYARWGDYTSVTVDPTDDCTFWFSEEYEKASGGFNWSTAIGTFSFPGCSGSASPSFTLNAAPNTATVSQGSSSVPVMISVVPANGFSGSVTLNASGLPSGVTAAFGTNPTTSTSTLTFTATATAATGPATVTVTGMSGSLTANTSVTLTVNATVGGAVVTLTPTTLKWNTIVVGVTGSAKTVTLKNTGTATLNISNITISGDFSQVPVSKQCVGTVLAGASCFIKVDFTPTQTGLRSGTISISDNAADSPQTVPLSGTGGAQASLTPASATYAAQKTGTTSAAKVFTLTNHQSIALNGVAISTTGDFSVSTTTCGTSVAALGHCTISVVFTPTQTGTRTGTLSVSDSAMGSPQTSNLTGTGK